MYLKLLKRQADQVLSTNAGTTLDLALSPYVKSHDLQAVLFFPIVAIGCGH